MSREVRFCVNCADTRVGQHVRVVGSSKALGEWKPQASPPLATTASDFPLWRSEESVLVDEDSVVEYKYVICGPDGRPIRWEERANRNVHFGALADRGKCPARGFPCAIVEFFNTLDLPESPNRFCGLERESSTAAMLKLRNQQFPDREHPSSKRAGGADMFEPTMRERVPSMLNSKSNSVSQIRSVSMSLMPEGAGRFCDVGPVSSVEPTNDPEVTDAHVEEPSADVEAGDGELGMGAGLFREESCSNLFIFEPEDDKFDDEPQEFEQRYALIGQGPLGEGTFGLVWRCVPKDDSTRECAAKIVKKARLQPRDMKYLLGDDGEVKTHLTMKHPNIVELFEYFDEQQSVTLVLEFCQGGDLFDAIIAESACTKRGFSEKAAAVATHHVLSALAYLHGQKVVHRDVKCENVLLAWHGVRPENNVFKLCDFGFAAHDHGEGFSDRLGSPDTVAPEVVAGKRYSFPADLWSAGTLIYMMLSATPPFWAPTDNEVLRKVRHGSYSLSGPPWESISAPPKHVITSLMTVDDKLRPTAAEALKKAWLEDVPPMPSAPPA